MTNAIFRNILKFPKISIAASLTLCLLGIWLGRDITMNLAIEGLLPDDRESVSDMHAVAKELGGSGNLIVLIGPTQKPDQWASGLLEKLRQVPNIKYAYAERESYLLREKALYLLAQDDFQSLFKKVKRLLIKKSDAFDLGLSDNADSTTEIDPEIVKLKDSLKEQLSKAQGDQYFVSKDKKYLMVLARPTFDSMDLDLSQKLLADADKEVRSILPPGVPFTFLGRYQEQVNETQQFQKDVAKTGIIGFLAIGILLFLGLGSVRASLLIILATTMGMGLTIGLAKTLVGQINILTGFLLAILSGLGTEYGIHLIRRYFYFKKDDTSAQDAADQTLKDLGPSLLSASLTSACAFFILIISDFKGFNELGKIAGAGILAIFLVYVLIFPLFPIIFPKRLKFTIATSFFDFYAPKLSWAWPVTIGTLLIIACVPMAKFEFEFDKMHGFSKEMQTKIKLSRELFGRSLTPTALVVNDWKQARELEMWLANDEHRSIIDQVYSRWTLIPEDAEIRFQRMQNFLPMLEKYNESEIENQTGLKKSDLLNLLGQRPYQMKDLPEQISEAFGPKENVVLVYPKEDLTIYPSLKRFTHLMKEAKAKFPGAKVGSEALVFNEIIDHIINDGKVVLLLFIFGSFFIFWPDFRSLKAAFFLEAQLILGGLLLVGLMGLVGVKFTILNVAMIPAVLATGIDMGVHILHREMEGHSPLDAAKYVASGVNLSALATMFGFGSLFFADAEMLKGIAWISVLGQLSMYIVCMMVVPVLKQKLFKIS